MLLLQHNSCAIHVASQGKNDIVQMLLDAGCNVNAVDDVGFFTSYCYYSLLLDLERAASATNVVLL